ncbi:beta-galactosidase [Sphingomonas sp. AP4-R1]|uniref:beta-galactosidase n=1 Tax=Sphingomonas sp. AP4-R1 TaxID=2735134 RepID=UPI0020A59BDA|nr:beta-galactosidase [Sphingomonas sp. AP4-R1]
MMRAFRSGIRGSALALLAAGPAFAATVTVDATAPSPQPRSGHLIMGTGAGPHGTLGVDSRELLRDGKPWLPVMGEFHYTRTPAAEWDAELAKMKASGVSIVATYIIWNQIEQEPGRLDWTGDHDLRRFAQLCAKHGLMLFVRPGPWAHAETRFGGIPDWIVGSTRPRSNDPAYLAQVERFWSGIGDQLKGQLWKEGGPVVGFQLENEYNTDGPGQGRDHIQALKALALKLGFDVPLYTVTGWDHTIYPRGQVLPVFGGYPDEPWSAKTTALPPKENYLFRFHSRVSGDLGAQTKSAKRGDADDDIADTPFLGAEYGGGVPTMYRRRPILQPEDIAAAVTTQVGSGVNLLGYYMFHGGANPLAHGRTLEESSRSGGYNDVPAIGYDFQAPIGQYGEINPVNGALRPLHAFLEAYGDRLAPMVPHEPAVVPSGPGDRASLRWSLRSAGDSGFLFVNNHIRQYPMAKQSAVRFTLKLPGRTVTMPSRPIDIASGASFFWPIDLDLDGVRLAWATAQPMTRLEDRDGPIHVLAATQPGPVELAFDAGVRAVSVPTRAEDGGRLIAQVIPAPNRIVTVTKADGGRVRLLVLDPASAKQAWVGEVGGQRRLVLTPADLTFDGDQITLRKRGGGDVPLAVWPAVPSLAKQPGVRSGANGAMIARLPAAATQTLTPQQSRAAGEAPPVEIGGPAKAAMQPLDEAHRVDAAWTFSVTTDALPKGGDAFLEIDYRGDIGRLFDGTTMIDDAFWDGRVWRIGLRRFAARLGHPWTLTVMPLRADAPIYLDEKTRALVPAKEQVADLLSVRLIPESELTIRLR